MNKMHNYFVYITANKVITVLYIGVTNNLIKRIWEHKNKVAPGFTAKYNVDKLVYYENYSDINEAIKREKQLKRWSRKKKIDLIKPFDPTWKDLYEDLLQ